MQNQMSTESTIIAVVEGTNTIDFSAPQNRAARKKHARMMAEYAQSRRAAGWAVSYSLPKVKRAPFAVRPVRHRALSR